jgi:hypothetical protein
MLLIRRPRYAEPLPRMNDPGSGRRSACDELDVTRTLHR